VLAHILVGIEFLRPGQRLGFGDRRTEPLPRHDRDDRVKGVLLARAGGNQRSADASIQADLIVDGAGIGLEGAGLPPLGLAEHRADQPAEEIDGRIGQARGNPQAGGHQCRVPPLPLVARDMLNRGAAGLARELRQARLVDEMAAAGRNADPAHMLQPLD